MHLQVIKWLPPPESVIHRYQYLLGIQEWIPHRLIRFNYIFIVIVKNLKLAGRTMCYSSYLNIQKYHVLNKNSLSINEATTVFNRDATLELD